MTPLIRASDLSVSHAGADLPVLRHVDFRIDPAEIVTVVGPNGSGKSTLVRALLGHVPADTGRVERLPPGHGGIALTPILTALPDAMPIALEVPMTALSAAQGPRAVAALAIEATRKLLRDLLPHREGC